MAVTKGKDGRLKVGANTVAEVRSFQFDRNAVDSDTSTLEDTWDDSEVVTMNWAGSAVVFWDPSDTNGQGALEEGMVAHAYLYPAGTGNGATYWHGNVIVMKVGLGNARDGIVEASIDFKGKGVLTKAVVGA